MSAPPAVEKYQVVDEQQMAAALVTECWPHEAVLGDAAALQAAALRALERWTAQGLTCRVAGGGRFYDPCEVFNFMKTAFWSRGDQVWASATASHRRDLRTFNLGRARSGVHSPARFLVKFRREFNLASAAPGSQVRLRVPIPFEDRTQRDIEIAVVEPLAGIERGPGRMELRMAVPEQREMVAIEIQVRLTACCETIAVDPARLVPPDPADGEVQLYTRPIEGFVRVTEPVARLARSLAGNAGNAWEAVQAFWRFFFARMKLGSMHPDDLGPDDPLGGLVDGAWVDCLAGSALLVSLCRARGIPARLVGGIGLDLDSPGHHYWFEVLLPPHGWVPFDLMSWDLARGDIGQAEWSQHYFGHLDYRMKTECLPRTFTGHLGVSRPAAWYSMRTRQGEQTEVAHHGIPGGLIYRDLIQVSDLAAPSRG